MISNSQMQSGYITRIIDGNWLTNGHFEVCILKLDSPSDDEWQNDSSRANNFAIIKQLIQPIENVGESLLEQEFRNKPSLVLAPELAFGSSDFESVDHLVKQYSQNLILICGFGFPNGSALITQANKSDVEGTWNSPPNANKKYNGGWVWVKNSDSTKCYIFLKNYFEQGTEITVPNLTQGDNILRLEGNDVVIFPTICADLISKEINSPSKRIIKSLIENDSSNKKILITGSLLNANSASGHWKAAIGDLLEGAPNARLLLSNCINPPPLEDEDRDKWRCLSGVYQHREGCKPPQKPLPNIRYVDDTKFSGLVLRTPETGVVIGKLQWTNNSSQGLHAFSGCSQYIWRNSEFHQCDGICDADELYRFVLKHKGKFLHTKISSNDEAKALSDNELNKLLEELSPASNSPLRPVAGKLFQKCLKGIKSDAFCSEHLHSEQERLDCAITTLKLIQYAINAKILPHMPKGQELGFGQLLSADNDHEILIWDSSEHKATQLYNLVKESIVKDGGSARPLIIIGRGNGGGTPPNDGRIRSNRLADISNAPPLNSDIRTFGDRDICEASDRVVFWKNQEKIDDVLSSTDTGQSLVEKLKQEISISEDS